MSLLPSLSIRSSRTFVLMLFSFLLGSLLVPAPSLAAEKIVVRYGIFEQSLPVVELRSYAETRKVSSALQDFLRYLDSKDKEKLQEALQVKMSLDIVALDKLLDTRVNASKCGSDL